MSSTVLRMSNDSMSTIDRLVNFFVVNEDLRTKQWFLGNTPWPLFSILAVYLYFCLSVGPRLMRDRKPFELKTTLLVYNAIQVYFSWVLFYEVGKPSLIMSTTAFLSLTSNTKQTSRKRCYFIFSILYRMLAKSFQKSQALRK